MRRSIVFFLVVAAIAPASALAGPGPHFRATAGLTKPTGGSCSSSSTAIWRNVPAGVNEVDFTFFVNGTNVSGEFDNTFSAPKSGSVSASGSPSVPSGGTFSFSASYKSGTVVEGTATSRTLTC